MESNDLSYNISFGEKIKKERIKQTLSLRELGEKIGLSAMYLCDLERGKRNGSDETIKKIANGLQIDAEYLKKLSYLPKKEYRFKLEKIMTGSKPVICELLELIENNSIPISEIVRLKQKYGKVIQESDVNESTKHKAL